MFITLALVIFATTIVVFFSQEFGALFKKLFAIPGVKLFLPLVSLTGLVVFYNYWVLQGLLYIKRILYHLLILLTELFPFTTGSQLLAGIIIIMAFTVLPMYLLDIWNKRKPFYQQTMSLSPALLGIIIWLILVILFSVKIDFQ